MSARKRGSLPSSWRRSRSHARALSQQLRTASTTPLDGWVVCVAFALTQGDAAAWSEFVGGLEGVELSAEAAEMLADLSRC
ncbi:hypothetical protein WME89_00610 [Sorangium sp. So ce321]|uniref:hypothetical protein n=1 Tax=Sorangium sp. So ce321 TaxID=3133300 RepID=UPI003F5EE863